MVSVTKTKAEKQYAEMQKKDKNIIRTIQSDSQIRLEKSAQLRQLRLTVEARDAAEKLAPQERKEPNGSQKKPRVRRGA